MRYFLLLVFSCWLPASLLAAPYYWVGGSGDWDDVGHWATTSGGDTFYGSLPSANDDVFIDANSFDGPNQRIDLRELDIQCRNLTIFTTLAGVGLEPPGNFFRSPQWELFGSVDIRGTFDFTYGGDIIFRGGRANTVDFGTNYEVNSLLFRGGAGGSWLLERSITALGSFGMETGSISFADGLSLNCGKLNLDESAVADFSNLREIVTGNINLKFSPGNAGQLLNCRLIVNASRGFARLRFTGLEDVRFGSIRFNAVSEDLLTIESGIASGQRTEELSADSILLFGSTTAKLNLRGDYILLGPGTGHDWRDADEISVENDLIALGSCLGRVEILGGANTTISANAGTNIEVDLAIIDNVRAGGGADFTATSSVANGNTTGWTFEGTVGNDRYWIGGTGDWTEENNWSFTSGGAPGACPPTAFDNAFFDANSFDADGQRVTLPEGGHLVRTMDWRGIDDTAEFIQAEDAELQIHGSLYLDAEMMWETSNTGVTFAGAGTDKEILTAGRTEALAFVFSGPGSEWTLLDEFRSNSRIRFRAGLLRTAGQDVRATSFDMLNVPFTLIGGTSTFYLSAAPRGGLWRLKPNGTGYYELEEASLINENTDGAVEFAMENNGRANGIGLIRSLGPLVASNVVTTEDIDAGRIDLRRGAELQLSGEVDEFILQGGFSYNFIDPPAEELSIGTLTTNGSCLEQVTIQAMPGITFRAADPQAIEWVQLRNVAAVGPSWAASNSIDLGGNPGWDFSGAPAPRSLYWVGEGGDWSDPAHWSLASGGAGGECPPSQIDDVTFDAASFNTVDQEVGFTPLENAPPVFCRTIETGDLDRTVLFTGAGLDIYGSAYLSENVHFASNASNAIGLTFRGGGDVEFSSRAVDLYDVTLDRIGTVSLLDSIEARRSVFQIRNGAFQSNSHLMRWGVMRVSEPTPGADPQALLALGASVVHIYASTFGLTIDDDPAAALDNSGAHFFDHGGSRYSLDESVSGLSITFLAGRNGGEVQHSSFSSPEAPARLARVESFTEVEFSGPIRIDSLLLNKGTTTRFNDRRGVTLIENRLIAIGSGCSPIDLTGPRANQSGTIRFGTNALAEMDYVRLDHVDATGPGGRNAGRNSINVDNSSTGWEFETNPVVQTLDRDFLGPDITDCGNLPATLRPNTPPGFQAAYRWQDGTTTPEFSPPGPGTYSLVITFGEDSCTLTDQITLSNGDLALLADQEINACGQRRYTITVPDPTATGYSWNVVSGNTVGTPSNTEITVEIPATVELSQRVAGCVGETIYTITGGSVAPIDTSVRLCTGATYTTDQGSYTPVDGETITETYPTTGGCDSVRNVTFIVDSSEGSLRQITRCANRFIELDGTDYFVTQDTTITSSITTVLGCDSTQVYEVVVTPATRESITLADFPEDVLVTDQGTYPIRNDTTIVENYVSLVTGCDSTVVYRITRPRGVVMGASTEKLCGPEAFRTDRNTYFVTQDTSIQETYTTATGQDSLHTYTIEVGDGQASGASTVGICGPGPVTTNRSTYFVTRDTSIVEIYASAEGCDSLHTVTVLLSDVISAASRQEFCGPSLFTTDQESYFVTQDTVIEETYQGAAGCDSLHRVTVTVATAPNIEGLVDFTDISCAGANDASLFLRPGREVDSLSLNGSTVVSDTPFDSLTVGTYAIVGYYGSGCSTTYEVTVNDPPPLSVDLPERPTAVAGASTLVDSRPQGGTGELRFSYVLSDSLLPEECRDCSTLSFTPRVNTLLNVSVTDERGCTATDSTLVVVTQPRRAYLPTAFSPNGDGVNDVLGVFGPTGGGVVSEFSVFDRWGGLIYSAGAFDLGEVAAGWDGGEAPAGQYLVIYSVLWPDQRVIAYSGLVNLLR